TDDATLRFVADGKSIGANQTLDREFQIPGLNNFKVVAIKAIDGKERHIELRFSDPLATGQNLRGLLRIKKKKGLRFSTSGSIVRIYSTQAWRAKEVVIIEKTLKNKRGFKLKEREEREVQFITLKPSIRFASKGVIVPTSQGLTLPVEVAHLNSVEIEAIKIFDENLPQFLQVNNLDGNRELKRVGRSVWKKRVQLDQGKAKRSDWVRYGLDLSPLIENHKNGLYQINLTFSRRDIEWHCPGENQDQQDAQLPTTSALNNDSDEENENSFWDFWEGSQSVPYWEMRNNRNNPCHAGYYREFYDHNIRQSRSVMISDIGLIAKRGQDDKLFVVATDLRTTQPLMGARLRVLDYQQQELVTAAADSDGFATLTLPKKPFVLIAEHNNQVGVLKLDDGSALSTSHFDVSGVRTKKGLRGFFYGERGIWRPGDDIYLTFVLWDPQNAIPEGHPLAFELTNSQGQRIERIVRHHTAQGFYVFKLKTDADAPTGDYQARVFVGGATFHKTLSIEAIAPNRLKIDMDFGKEQISVPDNLVSARLAAQWLHGATADGLKTDVELTLTSRQTRFKRFTDYEFN
ncbi:hypothetical protein KAI87_17415, partial [Myxococcota bacterium]|nr:hypothetical protein [Myxococcota bacterium]